MTDADIGALFSACKRQQWKKIRTICARMGSLADIVTTVGAIGDIPSAELIPPPDTEITFVDAVLLDFLTATACTHTC